jgi:hypothetical protein
VILPNVLRRLLEGEYLCQYRFRDEHSYLLDVPARAEVEAWLGKLEMRLARLGDDGAFFMAPNYRGEREVTKLKGELMRFRDEYGPAVRMLNLIRQGSGGDLNPGMFVPLVDLEQALADSSSLEAELRMLHGVVDNLNTRNNRRDNLRRLVEHLVRDGFLMVADARTDSYRVTGKIEQLYSVLAFLDEQRAVSDAEVDDQGEEIFGAQARLDERGGPDSGAGS